MADVYKLEWTHSRKTIQSGIGEILNKDAFMDTIVVCRDGVLNHNKLTLGLVFPNLNNVSAFDIPLDQTIIMPDHSVMEIQALIGQLFPAGEVQNATFETKGDEIEVHMEDNNFEHFLDNEQIPKTYGMRRGRGRPCMNNSLPPRFQCDFCNKGFYYKSMLSAHEKSHTGGTRETCEICGAEYSTRQNLKNHMVKYHGADSFVPRKRGRPPIDPVKRNSDPPIRPYRGRSRGRPSFKYGGLNRGAHSMSSHSARESDVQYDGLESIEYSNDANDLNYTNDSIEYQDVNSNMGNDASNDEIITESYLEQNLNDDDSDIAEEDPVMVDPSTEKIEPSESNEYIEVKDDFKETDTEENVVAAVNATEMEPQTNEHPSKESSASGETSNNLTKVSEVPATSTYRHSEPLEKEYQIELQDVQKLSILTKPELVSICKRNNISVTGEKQALAARILRKLGKIFDDEEN